MKPGVFYNCHGTWNCQGIDSTDGRIFHAVGFPQKRDCSGIASAGFSFVDCDPLVWGLPYGPCSDACNKIATHEFLPIDTPAFDGWAGTTKEWLARSVGPRVSEAWPPTMPTASGDITGFLLGCLKWQEQLAPAAYVIPMLPLSGPDPDLSRFLKWVRAGIKAGQAFSPDGPRFLTLTIEDSLLPSVSEMLLDQLTALDGFDGVLLEVVSAQTELSERFGETSTASILGFVSDLSPHRRVVVNALDIFGIAALGAGAEGLGIGYELKGTRLNPIDFRNSDSRGAFPKMLSLAFCKRLSIDEVENIRDVGLLDRLESDRTDANGVLLDAVAARRDIRTLEPWRPDRGKVAAARRHFILSHEKVVNQMEPLSLSDRAIWVRDWLTRSNENVNDYCSAVGRRPQQMGLEHVAVWLKAVS